MRLLLKHAAASAALLGISAAALGPLIAIPPTQVASIARPALA
jgi:hypothetical protein